MIRLPPHQTLFKHEHEQFCGHWKYSEYMMEIFRIQVILKQIEYKNIVNFLRNNNNKYLFVCQKEAFRFNFMFILWHLFYLYFIYFIINIYFRYAINGWDFAFATSFGWITNLLVNGQLLFNVLNNGIKEDVYLT